MVTEIILTLAYLAGARLCFAMLKVEHLSEGKPMTNGDVVLAYVLSALSFAWVLAMLIIAWVQKINATGYWNRSAKPEPLKPVRRSPEPVNDDDE